MASIERRDLAKISNAQFNAIIRQEIALGRLENAAKLISVPLPGVLDRATRLAWAKAKDSLRSHTTGRRR